jgi:hypothetical protein
LKSNYPAELLTIENTKFMKKIDGSSDVTCAELNRSYLVFEIVHHYATLHLTLLKEVLWLVMVGASIVRAS